ncbi:MAG: substrate-binding domain-containing protein [Candidatus Izemoplasmatales bacterium]|nr:substrate-binding domain-containing protein [bacterium]MDZ4197250.1 substrate-binding domain-containing protein [Candidatus Izemoplasmatales bacterium]
MKKIVALFSIMFLGLVLAACQTTQGTIVIGANIYTYGDNFMNGVVRPELVRYAAQKGVTLNIVDSENDQAKLNDQVDNFISQGVDVLAINLVDPAAAGTIINKAKAAGIPLILFNKEATVAGVMNTYDKVWYVGTDSAEAGVIQGQMMLADWQANPSWDKNGDGKVQYVLLKGESGHPDAEARTRESVKAFTDAGIVMERLGLQDSNTWNTAEAQNTMQSWITSFGNQIELVISNNDGMAFGAVTAMKSASKVYPIYGVDALAQALQMIGVDELNGTVLNDGVNQARATIDLAINAAQGKPVTEGTSWVLRTDGTKAVRVAYVAVTKQNYQSFQ